MLNIKKVAVIYSFLIKISSFYAKKQLFYKKDKF